MKTPKHPEVTPHYPGTHGARIERPSMPPFVITAEIDRKTFKVKEYTYFVKYNNGDSYTSEPLNHITQEQLTAAYKVIENEIRQTKRLIAKGKKHPAYQDMRRVVEAFVKSYKDDFYYYDLRIIGGMPTEARFLWLVKNSGTWLIRLDQSTAWAENLIKHQEYICYYWHGDDTRNVTYAEAQKLIDLHK